MARSVAPDERVDLCVLGTDLAGIELAYGAAALGRRVALVGATGLATGAESMAAREDRAFRARMLGHGLAFGHEVSIPRLGAFGIAVHPREARFVGPNRLHIGDRILSARAFVLAPGLALEAHPVLPPGLSAEFAKGLIDAPPASCIVIGSSAHAAAAAQALARAGTKVTLISVGEALFAEVDDEIAALLRVALARAGIEVLEGAEILEASRTENGVWVELRTREDQHLRIEADAMIRTAYHPALDGLDLHAAGLGVDRGCVLLDQRLQTPARAIYVAGDAAGLILGQGTGRHLGRAHARFLLKRIFFRLGLQLSPVPHHAATLPPIAAIGPSEAEVLADAGQVFRVSLPPGDAPGLLKLFAGSSGRILGGTAYGTHAVSLMSGIAIAMRGRLRLSDLAELALPDPDAGAALAEAAGLSQRGQLRRPVLRRLAAILRHFGG